MYRISCGGSILDLEARTHIMGILNVTPDSFSDGGRFLDLDDALRQAERMVEDGADMLDVGGESTRPGSDPVPLEEEISRVVPAIRSIVNHFSVLVSIDTYKAEVARRALDAGASAVNDISALRFDPGMAQVVRTYDIPVVLMHMKGAPKTMQVDPTYEDLMGEIRSFLRARVHAASAAGIDRSKIIVDPGVGFGKTGAHNLESIARLGELRSLGCPILIGPSRKSFIGLTLNLPVDERLEGTLSALVLSVAHGAHLVRVHDVKQAVRAVRMADAILQYRVC